MVANATNLGAITLIVLHATGFLGLILLTGRLDWVEKHSRAYGIIMIIVLIASLFLLALAFRWFIDLGWIDINYTSNLTK